LEILEPITGKNAGVLLDSCSRISFFGLRDRAIILTLMDTGIRANELLSINLKDLFLNSCEIWIRKGKGGKFRKVFICEQTQQSIRAYLHQRSDDSPFLWITKSKTRLKYSGLREIMRRRSKRTGIPQPSLHSFRRFFALQMLRNGADIFSLQQLMGHADITILRRYLKQTDQDLKHAHEINSPVAFSNRVLDE